VNQARVLVFAAMIAGLPATALAAPEVGGFAAEDFGAICDRLAGSPDDPDLGRQGTWTSAISVATAEPACRQAVKDHPGERRYLYELGRTLERKADAVDALDAYRQAAALGSGAALAALGLMYDEGFGIAQDSKTAADDFQKAIVAGSPLAYGDLAYIYDHGELDGVANPAKAFELYQQGATAGDASAFNRLGTLYQWGRGVTRDPVKAEAMFRRAIESGDPDTIAEGKNDLAWLWVEIGKNLSGAEAMAADAVAEAGDDAYNRAAYTDTLAWVEHNLGKDNDALDDEERAIVLDEQSTYDCRLGDILAALGDKEKARAAWRRALSLNPPNVADEPDWNADAIRQKIAGP